MFWGFSLEAFSTPHPKTDFSKNQIASRWVISRPKYTKTSFFEPRLAFWLFLVKNPPSFRNIFSGKCATSIYRKMCQGWTIDRLIHWSIFYRKRVFGCAQFALPPIDSILCTARFVIKPSICPWVVLLKVLLFKSRVLLEYFSTLCSSN